MTPRTYARVTLVATALSLVAATPVRAQGTQESPASPPIAGPASELRLTMDGEHRSNGYAAGREFSMELSRAFGHGRRWHAGMRSSTRFALRDESVAGGFSQTFGRSTAFLEVEASPTHRVTPRWGVAGRVETSLGRGWLAHAAVRRRAYDVTNAALLSAGAERYVSVYRLAYTLFAGHIPDGGISASHLGRIDRLYGRDQSNLIGVGVSAGRELEHLGPAGILSTRVRALSLSGRHWATPRWGLTYSASLTRRSSLYDQASVSAGLLARF